MRKRHLAALVAAAALVASATSGADPAGQPISYNTSGDPANDATSNQVVNGGSNGSSGYSNGSSNGGTNGDSGSAGYSNGHTGNGHTGNGYASNGGSTTGYSGSGGNGSTSYGGTSEPDILKHGTGVSHLALLAGGNEVSPEGKADAGDENGKGAASLSLDPEAGTLCFGLVVNNIDGPVAAHIHQGKAGHNGPVVVPLKAPDGGNPGAVSGCIENVDRALLHAIHAHPWAYYVNIHTSAYPQGAIRGQIF